jgi:hypothetical protein
MGCRAPRGTRGGELPVVSAGAPYFAAAEAVTSGEPDSCAVCAAN